MTSDVRALAQPVSRHERKECDAVLTGKQMLPGKSRYYPFWRYCALCALRNVCGLVLYRRSCRPVGICLALLRCVCCIRDARCAGRLGWQELDAQVFRVSVCGAVVLEGNRADVWLTNPESNTVWLKLRIMDENGTVLGETGLIRPGNMCRP